MADKASWQGQNMKKGGACEPAVSKSQGKSVYPMGTTAQMNPKIATPTYGLGNLASANMKKPKVYMADGGDVSEESDKAAGLKASEGESVGFFERLRMGSIDDPSSEAYRRFGAGRGADERVKALPNDDSSDTAESKRLSNYAPVAADEPVKAEEAPKMTAADFQRTDKDTTPVAMPKPAAPRRSSGSTIRASASKPASPSTTLSQRLGKEYADLENAAKRAEEMPEATLESRRMVRKLADEKRRAYEAAADAEKTGRSVVFKR